MNNKKHAYLIIAHNNYDLLKKLIALIDDERNDIYIHIDKKSLIDNIDELNHLVNKSSIFIYKELKVYWGDISQVNVELFLLEKAIKNKYAYYHLLSGSDLPIKTQDYIHSFFNENYGYEFVHFSEEKVSKKYLEYVNKYHFFQKYLKISKYKLINKLIVGIEKLQLFIQKLFHVKRSKNIVFQKGANWFSITDDLANYVVSKKLWINKIFKYTKSADEFFLQTIVINSNFKNRLFSKKLDDDYHACMRYIDWKRGGPYVFRLNDFNDLIESDYLWARKFDKNIDDKIVEKIFYYLNDE